MNQFVIIGLAISIGSLLLGVFISMVIIRKSIIKRSEHIIKNAEEDAERIKKEDILFYNIKNKQEFTELDIQTRFKEYDLENWKHFRDQLIDMAFDEVVKCLKFVELLEGSNSIQI